MAETAPDLELPIILNCFFLSRSNFRFLPNSVRCKVSSIGQDVRHTDATGGLRAGSGEVPGSMSTGPRSMFFLKPTSKVGNKCRQLHRKRTSMSTVTQKTNLEKLKP